MSDWILLIKLYLTFYDDLGDSEPLIYLIIDRCTEPLQTYNILDSRFLLHCSRLWLLLSGLWMVLIVKWMEILTGKGLVTPMRTVPKAVLFRTWTAWARLAWLKSVPFTNINRSPGNKRPSLSAKPPATRERITITVCPGFMGSWESFRKWQRKREREE